MVMQKQSAPAGQAAVQKQDAGKKSDPSAALRGKSYDEQVQMMAPAAVQMEGATPPAAAGPTLRKGSKGDEVVRLQKLLNAAGASPQVVPDGDYGGKTVTAVTAFQSTHKDDKGKPLSPDGVCGGGTWAALIAATGGQTTGGGGAPGSGSGGQTSGGGQTNAGGTTTGQTTGGGASGTPPAPTKLTNPMFAGDALLNEVLAGKRTIASGAGDHIKKVQTALMNLGYDLPIYGADGSWGGEAKVALIQFQNASGVAATGVLDKDTMAALDKNAVAKAVEKTLKYGELFKDGLLDFTVGVGYDEDGNFDSEIDEIKARLESEIGLAKGSAGDAKKMYEKAGMSMPSAGGGDYYLKEGALQYQGKPINVLVRLVTYKDPEAKKAFLQAMQDSDVALYTGHGRYGSGPDFDHKEKGAGNIWINPDQTVKDSGTAGMYHKLEAGGAKKNEIQTISFDKKYKVWFFDGCNTMHYMKSIRQNKTIDASKTDVFGWGQEISTSTTDVDVLAFIQGLMKQQSAKQLIDNANKNNGVLDPKHGLHGEGLGDNPNA